MVTAPMHGGAGQRSDSGLFYLLDRRMQAASLEYWGRAQRTGVRYALGPCIDAASMSNYDELDRQSSLDTLHQQKGWYDLYADQPGFEYPPPREYWFVFGGLDFAGDTQSQDTDDDMRGRTRGDPRRRSSGSCPIRSR